jgi:hypothetical protein
MVGSIGMRDDGCVGSGGVDRLTLNRIQETGHFILL